MNTDRLLVKAKATTINGTKWVNGYYVRHETRMLAPLGDDKLKEGEIEHLIAQDGFADWNMPRNIRMIKINPATICQCTGIKDKNGVLIFEWDKVMFGENLSFGPITDTVIWSKDKLEYTLQHDSFGFVLSRLEDIEVIGNIRDDKTDEEELCQCGYAFDKCKCKEY